jgi:hypothetical protein
MAQPLSDETQQLLDAADRAIERSRALVEQARQIRADCVRELRVQEMRFAFMREIKKLK